MTFLHLYLAAVNWNLVLTTMTAVIALVTLIYVVRLMNRQLDVMNRQLTLMERQAEIIGRQSRLALRVIIRPGLPDGRAELRFVVRNHGNKAARDFYWHLWVPIRLRGEGLAYDEIRADLPAEPLQHSAGYVQHAPVYPGRDLEIGRLVVEREVEGPFTVQWMLIDEDGVFPNEGRGAMDIEVPRALPPAND